MAERTYRVRNPSGAEFGPASLGEICALIGEGRIVLDAVAAEGAAQFLPITQFSVFAKAFENRYGIDGQKHTSDGTPTAATISDATPQGLKDDEIKTDSDARPVLMDDAETMLERPPVNELEDTSSDVDVSTPLTTSGITTDHDRAIPVVTEAPIDAAPPPLVPRMPTPTLRSSTPEPRPSTPTLRSSTPKPRSSTPTLRSSTPEPRAPTAPPPRPVIPAPALPVISPSSPVETLTLSQSDATKRVAIALSSWGIVVGVLFGSGVIAKLGWTESQYLANSGFFYLRVIVLTVLGVVLSALALPGERPTAQSFALSPGWALVAIAAGAAGGLLAPLQHLRSALPIALSMTFLHAIAEESFFRGFLDRAIGPAFPELVSRTAVGATLYGLYTLTFSSMWLGRSLLEALLWSFAITFVAGIPLSLSYHLSRSFLVPLLCHLSFNGVMIAMSSVRL